MKAALRGLWLKCHRWTALGLGWLLIVSGLTGSLLVVARPLDRWLHPAYFVAAQQPAARAVSLEALRARLALEFGPKAAFSFRPPREAGMQARTPHAGNGDRHPPGTDTGLCLSPGGDASC